MNLSINFHCCRCQTAHTWCRLSTTLQRLNRHGSQLSDWCLDSFTGTRNYHYGHFIQAHSVIQEPQEWIKALLSHFPEVVQSATKEQPFKHSVTQDITTTWLPFSTHFHRLPPEWLKVAKQEFKYMLQQGIMCPSSSNWASPLHTIPK